MVEATRWRSGRSDLATSRNVGMDRNARGSPVNRQFGGTTRRAVTLDIE
jgi:hypothetical protein